MREIHFVIPAAGQAVRFGGMLKELLPISEIDCGLTNAVRLAYKLGGTMPTIVTTTEKLAAHQAAVSSRGLQARFIVDSVRKGDMWGAVLLGMSSDRPGGLLLPDSVPELTDEALPDAAIVLGCFHTKDASQFSCVDLRNAARPRIDTKPDTSEQRLAWGLVAWSAEAAADFASFTHFDRAFEAAMTRYGYGITLLNGYADLGSFARYTDFIAARQEPRA